MLSEEKKFSYKLRAKKDPKCSLSSLISICSIISATNLGCSHNTRIKLGIYKFNEVKNFCSSSHNSKILSSFPKIWFILLIIFSLSLIIFLHFIVTSFTKLFL